MLLFFIAHYKPIAVAGDSTALAKRFLDDSSLATGELSFNDWLGFW